MKYPSFLKKNDLIAVPAPSAGAADELKVNKFKYADKYFKDNGYRTLLSKNIFNCNILHNNNANNTHVLWRRSI